MLPLTVGTRCWQHRHNALPCVGSAPDFGMHVLSLCVFVWCQQQPGQVCICMLRACHLTATMIAQLCACLISMPGRSRAVLVLHGSCHAEESSCASSAVFNTAVGCCCGQVLLCRGRGFGGQGIRQCGQGRASHVCDCSATQCCAPQRLMRQAPEHPLWLHWVQGGSSMLIPELAWWFPGFHENIPHGTLRDACATESLVTALSCFGGMP